MKYPDFVKTFKPKGSIVKKVRDKYYVYEATSKRVEGKKYPVQVIKSLLGFVDEYGFHKQNRAVVLTDDVVVRECGFTNYMLMFKDTFIRDNYDSRLKRDAEIIFYSFVLYLSSNSYLQDIKHIETKRIDDLLTTYKLSLPRQLKAICKVLEVNELRELEELKNIFVVKAGERILNSVLSTSQKELIEQLGVKEDDIRGIIIK